MEFLETVEAFLAATEISPTTFGKEVLKDPQFVFDLRNGRSPNLATVEKVRAFILRRGNGVSKETKNAGEEVA